MSKEQDALKLALEALEYERGANNPLDWHHDKTIGIVREALAEQPAQQQEPVAWRWTESNGQHWFDWRTDWTHHDRAKAMGFAIEYAYTSPPASKPWVGLTDEDKNSFWRADQMTSEEWEELFNAIEAKLREKNA